MSDCGCHAELDPENQRKVLTILLMINRDGEVYMRASWIFSKNDVIANVGVITAGILVAYFESALPDLIIGAIIVSVVLHGSYQIFREAINARVDGNI